MSNNSDDIRTFLTSGSRAKVPPRNARLSVTQPTAAPQTSDEKFESEATPESPAQDLSGLQAELEKLPAIGKRLAIHLERDVRADLVRLCDEAEITPETLIEAACAYLQERPDLLEEIVADARVRLKQRKRAGSIRRTLSMAQKYGV